MKKNFLPEYTAYLSSLNLNTAPGTTDFGQHITEFMNTTATSYEERTNIWRTLQEVHREAYRLSIQTSPDTCTHPEQHQTSEGRDYHKEYFTCNCCGYKYYL